MASAQTLSSASEELHMLSHQVGAARPRRSEAARGLEQENRTLREQLPRHTTKTGRPACREGCSLNRIAGSARSRGNRLAPPLRPVEARLRSSSEDSRRDREIWSVISPIRHDAPRPRRGRTVCPTSRRAASGWRRNSRRRDARRRRRRACCKTSRERDRPDEARRLHRASQSSRGAACCASAAAPVSSIKYRSVVERCAMASSHRNSGLKQRGPIAITARERRRRDLPSGNVSHAAYYVVKRYCKQHGNRASC